MIRVVCTCGRAFKAEDRHAGRRTNCPECGAGLTIGQTAVSSSSGGDVVTPPSWWYPGDTKAKAATERNGSDPAVPTADTMVLPTESRSQTPPQASSPRPPTATPVGMELPPSRASIPIPSPASRRRSFPVAKLLAILGGSFALTTVAFLTIFWLRPSAPTDAPKPPAGKATGSTKPVDPVSTALPPASITDAKSSPTKTADAKTTQSPSTIPRAASPVDADAQPRTAHGSASSRLKILVPAYIYPGGEGRKEWQRLIDAASKVEIVAIANPDSGPGRERNIDYATVIADAANQGVKLVGYVSTDYGRREVAKIKTEIDDWIRFYPQICGFFLDQQPSDGKAVAMFSELRDYVKQKLPDPLVITNPGIPCSQSYLAEAVSNVTCVFVNYEGFEQFELPAALSNYDASRFAAFPYNIPTVESMRALVKDAIVKRIGYLYISDSKPPTRWGKLPDYWEAEVDAISRVR